MQPSTQHEERKRKLEASGCATAAAKSNARATASGSLERFSESTSAGVSASFQLQATAGLCMPMEGQPTPSPSPSPRASLDQLLSHPLMPRYLAHLFMELRANMRQTSVVLAEGGCGLLCLYKEYVAGLLNLVHSLNDPQRARELPTMRAELHAAVVGARQLCAHMRHRNPRAVTDALMDVMQHNEQFSRQIVVTTHRTWLERAKLTPQQRAEFASAAVRYRRAMKALEPHRAMLMPELLSVLHMPELHHEHETVRVLHYRSLVRTQQQLLAAEHEALWMGSRPLLDKGVLSFEQQAVLLATDGISILPEANLFSNLILDSLLAPELPLCLPEPATPTSLALMEADYIAHDAHRSEQPLEGPSLGDLNLMPPPSPPPLHAVRALANSSPRQPPAALHAVRAVVPPSPRPRRPADLRTAPNTQPPTTQLEPARAPAHDLPGRSAAPAQPLPPPRQQHDTEHGLAGFPCTSLPEGSSHPPNIPPPPPDPMPTSLSPSPSHLAHALSLDSSPAAMATSQEHDLYPLHPALSAPAAFPGVLSPVDVEGLLAELADEFPEDRGADAQHMDPLSIFTDGLV